MLRKKTSKAKSVSEKISELLTRNASGKNESSDDEQGGEEPRVEDEFDEYELPDARSSDIRKRNVKLLSEQSAKYRGKISSRNELESEEQESEATDDEESEGSKGEVEEYADSDTDNEDDDDEGSLKAFTKKLNKVGEIKGAAAKPADDDNDDDYEESPKKFDNASDDSDDEDAMNAEEVDEEDEDDDDDIDDDIESSDDDNSEAEQADGNDIIAETNRQAEVKKGRCVQNQLQIWERLLEMRIRTQKILSKSNQLPAPAALKAAQRNDEKLAKVCRESVDKVSTLLRTFLQLQNALCEQFSEQRHAMKKSLKRSIPISSEDDPIPLKRYAEHLNVHFQEFKPYRNAVLLKWDDRTKLLTPGAGAKKKSLTEEFDIIRKIENTLQNRGALIKRSQMLKTGDAENSSNSAVAGQVEHAERLNVELYDDSDFYHQQLRELIEYKASTSVSASEVTQQFVELQKLRQKMKKKVDTRASKGRKLRYTVHNKLINFMAPDDTTTWTEESKDELYRSLFAS